MTRRDQYRTILQALTNWDAYLLRESGLPGPRGNLELAQAVADEGDESRFRHWLSLDPVQAPTNSPDEFLAFCGVLGLGRLLAEGRTDVLEILRAFAADPRWRAREAVAMALQRWGDADMGALLRAMTVWSRGTAWEQRAAAAALCEPRLLGQQDHAVAVLSILDEITASLPVIQDRRSDAFKALRKGLGYCWSVAVVACPEQGKRLLEKWFASPNPDIRWIMKENLRKNRLDRMDPGWTERWQAELGV